MSGEKDVAKLTDHLFRTESGKMVSVLTKLFGPVNLPLAEDMVQETLLKALQTWKLRGVPDNPSAWLYTTARNRIIDELRKGKKYRSGEAFLLSGYTIHQNLNKEWEEESLTDSQLKMMFVCCHPGISAEGQICLILKNLCGFSVEEISRALLTNKETISKRLLRARSFFRDHHIDFSLPPPDLLTERTGTVLNAIYLLFNEGYHSLGNELIRTDLIQESISLTRMLATNPHICRPEVHALLALMSFHSSREASRIDDSGEPILLEKQNRLLWNRELIQTGIDYLNKASTGHIISQYHLEAAIAYEHCIAPSFDHTNWANIIACYDLLLTIDSSPITRLNRTVIVNQVHGAAAALEDLEGNEASASHYLYHVLKGLALQSLKKYGPARESFQNALQRIHSSHQRKIIHVYMQELEAEVEGPQ